MINKLSNEVNLISCSQIREQDPDTFKTISPLELKEELDAGKKLMLIDVRTPREFNSRPGHIPGAVCRPYDQVSIWWDEMAGYPEREIVVYCQNSCRSGQAVQYMVQAGLQARELAGGTAVWNLMGFPMEIDI